MKSPGGSLESRPGNCTCPAATPSSPLDYKPVESFNPTSPGGSVKSRPGKCTRPAATSGSPLDRNLHNNGYLS
jgi:hypothetical protein